MVVVTPIPPVVAEDEVRGECDMATTQNARLASARLGAARGLHDAHCPVVVVYADAS
jgi:hypothetical protein